jgi:hypothetical protein
VRSNSIKVSILTAALAIIALGFCIKDGEFQLMRKRHIMMPNMIYFFLLAGLTAIVTVIFLISKRFPVATELISTLYGIFVCGLYLPIWFDDLKKPKIYPAPTIHIYSKTNRK